MSLLVSIERLSYAYPPATPEAGREWALRDVDLSVEAGETLAVMGPTGAGKSTLCLALNGLVPRSTGGVIRGRVRVAGLDTRREPVAGLAARVGMVFQDAETQLFCMSVEAEIAFGLESLGVPREEMVERIWWAAARVGVEGLLERSPAHLSGGQQQRVAIAAALATGPDLLVLDEPSAFLDPRGRAEVREVVAALRRERRTAIVLAETDGERVGGLADRVVLLEGGRITAEGPAGAILADVDRLRAAGLAPPPVGEIAATLNRRHGTRLAFVDLDTAARTLGGE